LKLILKVNLVLLLVFAIGILSVGYLAGRLLQENAEKEISENARIMMEAALAVRKYTAGEIKPLLETQIKYTFLPQIVPAYSANQYFAQLRKSFPDYSYKEATLNPTNPINRATDWEADIVNHFRQSPGQSEQEGERDTPNGRSFYLARPLKVGDAACLSCHDTPDTAPRTVVERYGRDNGFGWRLNDIIGAQIVSVPMQLPIERARHVFRAFMASLIAVFVVIFAGLNAILYMLVVNPVKRLAKVADEVSLGNMDVPEFHTSGKDEISQLAESFDRMRKSLVQAIKLLES
jgi:HAMP domain-containing protein